MLKKFYLKIFIELNVFESSQAVLLLCGIILKVFKLTAPISLPNSVYPQTYIYIYIYLYT